MKRKCIVWIVVVFCIIATSCSNVSTEDENKKTLEVFEENPVTITWDEKSSDAIESYQADVKVYSQNSRSGTDFSLQNEYRMSLKTIEDKQYVRIDMDPDYSEGVARSIISDGTDSIIFNADSGEVEYRFTTDTSSMADLAFLSDQTALTRMNLESIKTLCNKLAFDVDDSSNGALQISLPSNLFKESDGITRQSTTVLFDTTTETLNKVEIVTVDKDMTTVTTSTYPVYDDSTGTPIKVGIVTEVVSKATKMIDGINPDEMEWFESPEDIPEMSESEYEELQESGCIEEISDMTFCNPADPSYTETIAEVYEDVKINAVSDETFKLLLKE